MVKEELDRVLKNNFRNKVKYRDQYNFIVWGLVLSEKVITEGDQSFICVDSIGNKVNINKVIEIKAI